MALYLGAVFVVYLAMITALAMVLGIWKLTTRVHTKRRVKGTC